MKHSVLKRTAAVVLALITAFCSVSVSAGAFRWKKDALPEQYKNKYPFVFVHGFNGWGGAEGINDIVPYWGATCGDLMEYLSGEGYDCYSASVGPLSSAWDRACELYAQLTGTRVDYGEAHSRKYNHQRYGRTYDKPLFAGWGSKDASGNIMKIHLIGHSFGGTTIRLMTYLMTYGCPEEKKASPGNVSPLFTGGKENWIHSVTCICTPHNSATSYYISKGLFLTETVGLISPVYVATMGRSLLNGTLVDFHLEQFGLSNIPGEYKLNGYFSSIHNYVENREDSCQYDLYPENMKKFNETVKISPNVYYYSYAFDTTVEIGSSGIRVPEPKTNPVIAPISAMITFEPEFTDEQVGITYDDEWLANDALCNTISEKYPFTDPHKDYDGKDVTGIWNVMPVSRGDHGMAVGLLANKKEHRAFYLKLAESLYKTEK